MSTDRYLARNAGMHLCWSALISSLVNVSDETYTMRLVGSAL